ncbi:hypothetical protein RBB78_17390 [Tunturiibacter empetritectus]|uniref:hypothetical protein n=1 Tax=Tunturiibacter empetritectus TaxID=3069691 RepID=UPI003D9AEC30
MGAFSQMFTQVTSALAPGMAPKEGSSSGPNMAGVFEGAGHWRLDFIDGGVLVNCSFLSPNQEAYSLDFKEGRAVLIINTRPKPLVLTLHGTETITGPPGPVTIDGVVAGGYTPGSSSPGHTETSQTTTHEMVDKSQTGNYGQSQLTYQGNNQYDAATTHTNSTYVAGASTPGYTNFVPKRATCPAINLSSKGAGTGIQTMQTDLLKTAFGGDKGPPTPPGIRMHGIFAASTGFSVEFFPESVILGCGPDAARAYPYTVEPGASGVAIKIAAPDHPLALIIKPDGSLDPGSSAPYQVHGQRRHRPGQQRQLHLRPARTDLQSRHPHPQQDHPLLRRRHHHARIRWKSGSNRWKSDSNPSQQWWHPLHLCHAPRQRHSVHRLRAPPQPGAPNPLAGHPYTLLRNSVADILAKQGISVPQGSSPYKVLGIACGNHTPDCQKILDAVKANAASAIRADANGSGTFPGVAPGTYYLMISARYNNQALVWDHPIQLKPGPNSLSLDQRNATPIN